MRKTVVIFNPQPIVAETPLERYNALFTDVPLHGGEEWSLSVDELVELFHQAIDEGTRMLAQERADAITLFNQKGWITKLWLQKVRGWKAPDIPSREELLQEMTSRCRRLADWMAANQSRPFYAGSDMSRFISKPRAVADRLEKEL